MDTSRLTQKNATEWVLEPHGTMRVPGVLFADEQLIREMDDQVLDQVAGVASLPGIVTAAFTMPDAHWGYGFPIGGVAAFDAHKGGVVSAGGVGFDISCGVRTALTKMHVDEIRPKLEKLANLLLARIPAGVGSTGTLKLNAKELDDMLTGGAAWAVQRGFGTARDLARIENHGCIAEAEPAQVSQNAKSRQFDEMGTLGSGNHYLELQEIVEIYDEKIAAAYGLRVGEVAVSLHCGSRGLGHQVATDFSKRMVAAAARHGIALPDRELACAPIHSDEGRAYLGAMSAAINCALANRQILLELVRRTWHEVFRGVDMELLYDVSHNTCKQEEVAVDGRPQRLWVHRKGATRAFGPGHPELPPELRAVGQPVLIGGTMGTASYILAGTTESATHAFSSACHGAGRAMSRTQALKRWQGRAVMDDLAHRGIEIRTSSYRGIAEEAPGAYKDVDRVVAVTQAAGLSRQVAKLIPLACVKG
jgi:tRNA-splicing ligase RtcB